MDFQADPPLDTQISRIAGQFDDLTQLLSAGTSESPAASKSGRSKAPTFEKCSDSLQEAIHKFFCDIWRTLRSAQRNGDSAQVQSLKGQLTRELLDISKSIKKVRAEEVRMLGEVFTEGKESSPSDTIALPVHGICQAFSVLLIQDACDMGQKALDTGDSELTEALYGAAFDEVVRFGEGVSAVQDALRECVKRMRDANILNEEEAVQAVADVAGAVRQSRSDMYPIALQLFKAYGDVFEEDEDVVFDASKVFGKRLDLYTLFCNELATALNPEHEDDESDSSEEADIDERYVQFLRDECAVTGDDLIAELNAFWDWAHVKRWREQAEAVGSLIVQFLEARVDCRDQALKASDIAVPYCRAVKYNDDEIAEGLKGLLVSQIEQQISDLEKMRRQQLKNLSKPPSVEEDLAQVYIDTSKRLSEDIQKKAMDLNKAICQGREAEFFTAQRPKEVAVNDEDRETPYEEEDDNTQVGGGVFIQYDNDESTNIYGHLTDIRSLIENLYLNISAARSSGISVSGKKSVSDAASVYSSASRVSSKTTRMTKAEMNRLVKHMSPEEVKQSHCLEDALSCTYLQLFASIKGMITAAIRASDYNIALDMNKNLRENTLEYVNHLTSQKKRALEILDLEGAKAAEMRIQELSGQKNDEMMKCIMDSLRDLIEVTISNYYRNCDDIDDEFQETEDIQRKDLDKKFGDMERKVHMPNLVILEKQLKVAVRREEMRGTAAMTEKEDEIRRLAANNDFAAAERAKQRLEKARAEDLQTRIKAVEAKFAKQRKQMLAQQQRDLQVLEDAFNAKMEQIAKQKAKAKQEQLNTLASSVRSSQQRHVHFALKMLPLDAAAKKDLPFQFANIVRLVLKEHDLDKQVKIDLK